MLGYLLFILAAVWVIDELAEIRRLLVRINKHLDYVNVKLWSELNEENDEEED